MQTNVLHTIQLRYLTAQCDLVSKYRYLCIKYGSRMCIYIWLHSKCVYIYICAFFISKAVDLSKHLGSLGIYTKCKNSSRRVFTPSINNILFSQNATCHRCFSKCKQKSCCVY